MSRCPYTKMHNSVTKEAVKIANSPPPECCCRALKHAMLLLLSSYLIQSVTLSAFVGDWLQCDQMDRLFAQFWPISAMKICPIAYRISQINLKILLNIKWTLSKWQKFFNIMPKWWNFAKSGQTKLSLESNKKKKRKNKFLKKLRFCVYDENVTLS